jgi:hypothetical protein
MMTELTKHSLQLRPVATARPVSSRMRALAEAKRHVMQPLRYSDECPSAQLPASSPFVQECSLITYCSEESLYSCFTFPKVADIQLSKKRSTHILPSVYCLSERLRLPPPAGNGAGLRLWLRGSLRCKAPVPKMLRFRGCDFFRLRLLLSCITGRPVRIDDIRADDQAPGLRTFEASLLRLIEKVSNGCVVEINETGLPHECHC